MPATRPEPASRAAAGQAATVGAAAHDGLFGPGSVTWRVAAEPVMWVAGFRALYLQALHPRVMRGTWQNTAFADPKQAWGRFLRTVEFVQTRTYGSHAEVERAGRRIRKIHATLRGTDPDGTQFRLDEPELLRWVHCAEIGSYLDVARRCGIRLTAADQDGYVSEQRRAAAVVGLAAAAVPGSAAELAAYFEEMRPSLSATPEAKRALLRSLNPALPRQLLPLKLVLPGVTTLAFATLPRWARRMYGMPGSPVTDLTATASLRALREGTTGKPGQLLIMPAARAGVHAAARARRQRGLPAAS